ncbi:MAG: signal peptidase II [Firmicutes bacterium]|nr:signal peptidase II [Bacillota bacterium]
MPYFIILLIIVVDQLSKFLVSSNFTQGDSVRIFPYLYITYVRNVGAAFGLLANYRWLFVVLGILAVALVWYFRNTIKQQSKFVRWGITLAIGGTIGNLIDRIRIGAVIDFIDTPIFPIFNAADMTIVAGVVLLFWEVLINERKKLGE